MGMAPLMAVLVLLAGAACTSGVRPQVAKPPATDATTTTTTEETTTTFEAPAGYAAVVNRQAGFALAVPSTWKQLDIDSPDLAKLVDQLKADNPRIARVLDKVGGLPALGGKLFVIDPATADNVNIIVRAAGNARFEDAMKGAADEYAKAGARVVEQRRINLSDGDAIETKAELDVKGPSGTRKVSETQYYLLRHHTAYFLTVSARSPELDTIVHSFRVL